MNQHPSVFVRAPSRLHFGLLSFGNPKGRQFGGVGVMIDRPGLQLGIHQAATFEVDGPLQSRIRDAASRWARSAGIVDELCCKIEVITAPRLHAGLGVGTQLALAVATGLNAFYRRTSPPIEELAQSVGRGLRSAIGTYGFASGGLIAERGKLSTEPIAPLLERVALPSYWRFVLVLPKQGVGLHGLTEQTAFDRLPPVPSAVTERLTEIMCDRILPAARSANFSDFSTAVFDFGFLAGSCFASVQGSAYNGESLERLVERIRTLGVRGVGQSSWGPTIFSLCESESSAMAFVDELRSQDWDGEFGVVIASPDNIGATVSSNTTGL